MPSRSSNYRELLREVLASRCQRNPRYSLRSFARDLKISAPRLSKVLNGKQGLSTGAAAEIASQLGLSTQEKEYFCTLVESEHARTEVVRNQAKKRIRRLAIAYRDLGLDTFRFVAEWYHLAILELTQVADFQVDPRWIARQLGISVVEAETGLERLLRLKLIESNRGKLKLKGSNRINLSGVPSEAVRKYHAQILNKALTALELQSVDERDFSSITLAIDEADIPRAKQMLKEFRAAFDLEFSAAPKKQRVYNLSIQFIRLQEKGMSL